MKQYLFSLTKKRQYILLLGDVLVLGLSIFISYIVRFHLSYDDFTIHMLLSRLTPWFLLIIIMHILSIYILDQYNLNRLVNIGRSSTMILLSVGLAGLLISGSLFFFPKYVFGRQVFLIHLLTASFFMISWRLVAYLILIKRARPKRLAVVGDRHVVSSFLGELSRISNNGFIIKHVYISGHNFSESWHWPKSLTQHEALLDLLKCDDFDVLVFDSVNGSFSNEDVQFFLQLKYKGKAVYDLSTLYKSLTGKVPLTYVNGQWLLSSYGLQGEVSKPYIRVKRLVDICLSSFLLLLFSPLLLIIACLIKTEGKGGVLFKQERLGLGRKSFTCYKFRTMHEDAEKLSGPVWSTKNDPRITRLGRFLRKTRLDELPQLYNILKGEMSFVGPRPIREYFAIKMAEKVPFYWLRYDVKPGVTGWAQVNGKYAVPDGLEAFEYELFYIENMSIFLDLLTMFKTLQTIFAGSGK